MPRRGIEADYESSGTYVFELNLLADYISVSAGEWE